MPTLFDSVKIGDLQLPNRIVMAPLTRSRAGKERVPNDLMREYYVQRASAGLILTEATSVEPMGVGYADTPGIWSEAQTEGWKKIVKGVHEAGGRIFLQLWHVGRISDPSFLDGKTPVAPSAIAPQGHVSLLRPMRGYVQPRALTHAEIQEVVAAYKRGAENAQKAGFDGVEIHGANGYLIDQFLQDGSNRRTDEYGGSVENRARFLLQVTDAVTSVWGAGRVGMHLAPRSDSHDVSDSHPRATFGYAARELGKRKLAFLFARSRQAGDGLGPFLKHEFAGPFVANQGLTPDQAAALVESREADLVSFGQLFIANPDLVRRIRERAPLNVPVPETFYAPGPKGYTDYPALG
jgi:2,4-dienoyl-CoA reductase-like NADH-dependent reductase (Old Yellow Enzyme family)